MQNSPALDQASQQKKNHVLSITIIGILFFIFGFVISGPFWQCCFDPKVTPHPAPC